MSDLSDCRKFGEWLSHPPPGAEVVISGVSGRLPESNNIYEFQDHLFNKRDMITDDDRRWRKEHPEIPHRNAKIYDIDKIDAGYFGLHYRQTDIMNPTLRKILETTVEAIIDAGVNPSELRGSRTGVFIGACDTDVEVETLMTITQPQNFGVTGYLRTFYSHRISYFLGLKGPTCNFDTACSSSSNALELAFKSIRQGKCDSAIVGSVNLLVHPGNTYQFFKLGVLSSDATCKVFDEAADGYVRGETVASIFLQKSKDARRIYAQVVHTKVNHDGFKLQGITYPSSQMQEELMSQVLQESGINPSDLIFMEAHGTGTGVGDPEEVAAIDSAIAQKRTKPLLTGSVKCSVGHTEPSSGLCSIIKAIIAMETDYIPPNINLKNIKKSLTGFQQGRMIAVTETTKLENDDGFIGVNNFGFGGNNCHLILRRFNKVKKNKGWPEDNLPRLVCVSGRTEEAVSSLVNNINRRTLDVEYIGLLHQVFKNDINNHIYRGFTVVSKTGPIETHQDYFDKKKSVFVYFGNFQNGSKILENYLREFQCFNSSMAKIKDIMREKDNIFQSMIQAEAMNRYDMIWSMVVQLGIADIFKLLELELIPVYGDQIGEIISAYYSEEITLNEAVNAAFTFAVTKQGGSFQKKIETPRSIDLTNLYHKSPNTSCHDSLTELLVKSPIVNVSDVANNKTLSLVTDSKITLLETIGRLYEEGCNPQIDKLYPEVQYPVSRGTPMLSPLVKWDYRKSWFSYKFGVTNIAPDITQMEHKISASLFHQHKYMAGHVVDGRNLIPATAYLKIVWETFVINYNVIKRECVPIVFENCRFIKAVTLPKSDTVKLLVTINKGSGDFEVVDKDTVVVKGRIFTPDNINDHLTDLPCYNLNEQKEAYLDLDEIYRELYLRGYNYSGLFKGIVKCNVDASAALIRWEDNWVSFLDKMLQLKILQMDTKLLYVPTCIKKLTINAVKHTIFAEKQKDNLCPVFSYKDSNIIKSGEVEICGLQARAISKRKSTAVPVLEKYVFVPNKTETTLEESARIVTQLILENSLERNFESVEILDDFTDSKSTLILPSVLQALNDIPLVLLNLIVSSKTPIEVPPPIQTEDFALASNSNLLLVIASRILQRPAFLNQALNALTPGGYILTRENIDFVPDCDQNLEILLEHSTPNEKLILLKSREKQLTSEFVEITPNLEWLTPLQKFLKQNSNVVVYGRNSEVSGALGLVNCLRREPQGHRIKCFFMMDSAPKFDIQNPFYSNQLKKNLAFNIFKDQEWGTYRHLLLEDVEEVESEHFYLNTLAKGELSSLKWIQGPLNSQMEVDDEYIVVFPHYSALNFKDIMLGTGRIGADTFTTDRIEQECLYGFEFCGYDINGRRVVGILNSKAFSTIAIADKHTVWQIPDEWSLEDASTVIVVYSTVVYGLLNAMQIKPGMSVLIHSATGGIGLAALNVCSYYKCEIFVTVGTKEKVDYIKKHFPQIPESHIGHSRDTSFEVMIKRETRGRGVDVVLNSLTEEKLQATVRCLAVGGHFVEIGKYDLGNDNSLDLLLMEKKISYHGVMLDTLLKTSKEARIWLQREISKGMKLGYIKPLPKIVFQKEKVIDAFKYMMTGNHIGKVVVKIREENENFTIKNNTFKAYPKFNCCPEKSYIIIGGLGGVGLELADWLYIRGAKKLILVSRFGVQTGYQTQRIRTWTKAGVSVYVSTKDVTTKEGCLDLINEAKMIGAIDAIFNLAVVLQDSLFEDQTQESFKVSLAPKAQTTAFLDDITRECCPDLRHFVVFSSVSCGRGNVGQTNYGMANSIMERICEQRKNDGLPGLAIQWGAIGDVGLVAKMQKENKELVIGGTLQQKISSCLEVLDRFLIQKSPVVSSIIVADKFVKKGASGSAVEAVCYILGIRDLKSIDVNSSLAELGMDSIMGTEMIQILEKDFDIHITAKEVRTLTFAKLMELEAALNENEKIGNKIERESSKVIKPTTEKNASFVKMSSQVKDGDDLLTAFVLPGAEGSLESLEFLTSNLKCRVLGIQYNNYNPEYLLENCLKPLLPEIEEIVSREGQFFIIGYSFGVAVAVELAASLEKKNFSGILAAIDGSPAYLTATIQDKLSQIDEVEFQTNLITKVLSGITPVKCLLDQKEKFLQLKTFDERVDLALSILIPDEMSDRHQMKKQAILGLYSRYKSMVNYTFNGKIKSKVHLFKAKAPLLDDFEENYYLSNLCEQSVQMKVIEGNHYTILNQNQLVEDINELLKM